jgi:dinuclear metal center YbgI/SA1388 family protein
MQTSQLADYLDLLLDHANIADYEKAGNGLQIENDGAVMHIGAAVDACEATIRLAVARGVDFLIVHHGLLWDGLRPFTGATRRKLKMAFDGNLALYSSHLPLDLHPDFGNNAILARRLALSPCTPAFPAFGRPVGLLGESEPMTLPRFLDRVEAIVDGHVHLAPGGTGLVQRVAVLTGGGGSEVEQAARLGADTFVTGEGQHWTYTRAEEVGVNLIYAGHYATETFGVSALAAYIAEKLRIEWEFIKHPTGL